LLAGNPLNGAGIARGAGPPGRLRPVIAVLLLAPGLAAAAPLHADCEPVLRALGLLDAHAQVALRLEVVEGRHPDGYRRFEIVRGDGAEQRLIDARPVGPPARGATPDPFMLMPESRCVRPGSTPVGALALRYDAWAERGSSRVTMWIDTATGLPLRVEREGPELAWGRSLSRPTHPPRPQLRPTGRRILEVLVIEAGDTTAAAVGR
jgi:hypothetical protein